MPSAPTRGTGTVGSAPASIEPSSVVVGGVADGDDVQPEATSAPAKANATARWARGEDMRANIGELLVGFGVRPR